MNCLNRVVCCAAAFLMFSASAHAMDIFDTISEKIQPNKEGVKDITYEQFMEIGNANEGYLLADARTEESYKEGHIPGAISLPPDKIEKGTILAAVPAGVKVVVYCGSFKCPASTEAAKKLSSLGYQVLDYKGGIKEWQEKGNDVVKE